MICNKKNHEEVLLFHLRQYFEVLSRSLLSELNPFDILKNIHNYSKQKIGGTNKSEVTTELCSYQQLTCLVWPENCRGSHFVFAQFKGRNWKAQHFNKEIFSDFQT